MAVSMNIFGLIPIMAATGVGADVMKRLSSPMFGGLVSLTFLTLLVVPVAYGLVVGGRPADRKFGEGGRV